MSCYSPYKEFLSGDEASNLNTDASHLTYIWNWDIGEKIGDYYPVFNSGFSWSAQSTETLWNAFQHTDRKRRFVVYEHDQSPVLFFTSYGWKQVDFFCFVFAFLDNVSILCLWTNWYFANKGCFLHSHPKRILAPDKILTTVSKITFFHMWRFIYTKRKFLRVAFFYSPPPLISVSSLPSVMFSLLYITDPCCCCMCAPVSGTPLPVLVDAGQFFPWAWHHSSKMWF